MKPSYVILDSRSPGNPREEAVEILSGNDPAARPVGKWAEVTVTWRDRDCLWGWDVAVADVTASEEARVGVGRTFRLTPCPGRGFVEIY